MKSLMKPFSDRARWGLGAGTAAILLLFAASAAWLWRADDQVLFADLKPQDAAAMAAELDRQKIRYRIAADGTTLLVDGAIVHATRLKLMGKDLPLQGTAGFELFSNGDFGMTEFAQKINYQRALQGEITRTILALSEVRDARVHLALAEEGLFKRATSKPKAAITLTLKAGQSLRPEQIAGIQRLVAGAVPGIAAPDVTLVDHQGVALSRTPGAEGEADMPVRLEAKREMESLLARKATEVLEGAFGAGIASATVDVTLNLDQVRVTTEDVIGTPAQAGEAVAGVVVREREVQREGSAPSGSGAEAARAGTSQRDTEYQVGRRVEHVVSQPGAVRRLNVAAVLRMPLDAQQLEQARALVAAAVGAVAERGDAVVIQSSAAPPIAAGAAALAMSTAMAPSSASRPAKPGLLADWMPSSRELAAAVLALLTVGALGAVFVVGPHGRAAAAPPMTQAERQALLAQLKLWLAESRRIQDPRLADEIRSLPELRV